MDITDHNYQAGKNFIWLSFAQIVVRIMGAAFYFLLSFKLQADGLGQYNFISSFVPLWFLFIDFGASGYLYREWSKQNQTRVEIERDFSILFTYTSSLVFLLFAAFITVNIHINRGILLPLTVFFWAMYLAGYIHWIDSYLQANNIFRPASMRQIVEKFSAVAVGIGLIFWRPTVTMVFVAVIASQLISFLYYYFFYSGILVKIRLTFDWVRAKQLFWKGLPFLFIGLFSTIYAKIDMTMLRYMDDFATVGLYGAAYKFLDMATIFSSLFASAIFPVLSALHARKHDDLEAFIGRSLRIVFNSGILIAVAFIFTAPLLFKLFFPSSFSPSILVLRILILAQVLMFFSLLFNNLLLIQNKEKTSLYVIIISALLNIGLNFYLIPRYGMYGAAWATVAAEAVNLFMLQYYAKWYREWKMLAKMAFLLILNILLLFALRKISALNNLWIGAGILAGDVAALWVTGLLVKEDLELFFGPIKNKLSSLWPDPE